MPYDPQRSRHRPAPAEDDRPAPVDALLEGHPAEPALPEGVELDVTNGGEVVVHTPDADVEVTPSGDDVVVRTGDASIEVRAADDEVVVTTGDEELYVDTSPRTPADLAPETDGGAGVSTGGPSPAVLAAVAALVAALVVILLRRRRR